MRRSKAGEDGVPEVLVRFRDAVGVGRVGGPKIEEGRQPLYSWVASSRGDITHVGNLIGPSLSDEKRGQFTAAVGLRFDATPIDSLSWAAGFYDAEGSTSLSDHRSHAGYKYVEATVTQGGAGARPQELVRLRTVLGLGKVYGPYEQAGAHKPVYRWRLQRVDEVRLALHLLQPWLGSVKRKQAFRCLAVVDAQPSLPRGRVEWGSHKTQCIHGHEYASARLRPYVSRGRGVPVRESHRCLTCLRDLARRRRNETKIGGLSAADRDHGENGTTC